MNVVNEDFDFGFTSINSNEIDSSSDQKLDKVIKMILPLLNNLEADNKDYIYWPNRKEKIQEFKNKLYAIIND
jgi:hypothetical protein